VKPTKAEMAQTITRIVQSVLPTRKRERACMREHELSPETCRKCWQIVHVRRIQRFYGLPETGEYETTPPDKMVTLFRSPSVSRVVASLPCLNLGKMIADKSTCTGCRAKKPHRCDAGHGVVIPRTDCGPTCPDYDPDDQTLPLAEEVTS
jgi:hypothetical protein